MRISTLVAVCVLIFALGNKGLNAQQKRSIGPCDCATVNQIYRDITGFGSIELSPDGHQVAYLLESPNIQTNDNEIKLYIRNIPAPTSDDAKPLLVGHLSELHWTADGRYVTVLRRDNGRRSIERVDPATGHHLVLFETDSDLREYSLDEASHVLVYGVEVDEKRSASHSAEEVAKGYRIDFQTLGIVRGPQERAYVVRRNGASWSPPTEIVIHSPLSGDPLPAVAHWANTTLELNLSPNGKKLLLEYRDASERMPEVWQKSGFMYMRRHAGWVPFTISVLYDMDSGKTTVPLRTPATASLSHWSPDSSSFIIAGLAPVGTEEEWIDPVAHKVDSGSHLYWVEPSSGEVIEITAKLFAGFEGLLFWDKKGRVFARATSSGDSISEFVKEGSRWREMSALKIPVRLDPATLATDGIYVAGEYNDLITPPQLLLSHLGREDKQIFAKYNPQFDNVTLAKPSEIHWQTKEGFNASGLLLLPPDFKPGTSYPLVIHTKPFDDSFGCSWGKFPSFAPQLLANAGIIYLGPIWTKGSTQSESDYYPPGYPGSAGTTGNIAEAAFNMELWDSAIEKLSSEGMVNKERVGIIGFSHTGWYTEFILSHSRSHYRAATVADNVQYSLGEYWLGNNAETMRMYEGVYAGPPYGKTIKNWLDHSISFNIDKIHTPLLMEEMGGGLPYDDPRNPPHNLAASLEVFAGLNRLSKPVEMYYYPNETHSLDHPQARAANLQRSEDWYRFWLQGYERPNPEDIDQYSRWGHLEDLQQHDAAAFSRPTTSSEAGETSVEQ
ncbi:S9 family peptidase [Tunturiibacter gelidoferens]|uniref:Prolyl oligopeptidase family serine peptidase n=1 Tax=Tunturiibacter gelidiferens TaxID=3069689 RepID=A0AAU7YZB5_9BACT